MKNGLFVASENLTVMVSLFVNPLTSPVVWPSGSAAVIDMMDGPAFAPKLPTRAGDIDMDGLEVPSTFLRLPASVTCNLNSLLGSLTAGPTPSVVSIMVMTRTDRLIQEPM